MKSEEIVSKAYDKIAEKYYERFGKENEKKALEKLNEKLDRNSFILDAGCGKGMATEFLIDKGYKVIGIDISDKMLKMAKEDVPKAQFKKMSLYNLKFDKNVFDAIVSLFTILHLKKDKVKYVFKNFNRILKESGYLLFSVNEGKGEGYFDFLDEKMYFSSFTKKEIKNILKETNFEVKWQKDFLFEKENVKEKQLYYLVKSYS